MHYIMHRIPIGVLGASGYAGRELCALAMRHPRFSLAFATANEQRGKTAEVPGGGQVTFIATDDAPLESAQLVFSAMPHGASKLWVERARAAGAKAVDLSADLRIGNDASAVPYGLTEARRDTVRGADLVANPGCYPTAILAGPAAAHRAESRRKGRDDRRERRERRDRRGLQCAHGPAVWRGHGKFSRVRRGQYAHRHLNEMRAMLLGMGADADLLSRRTCSRLPRGILATMTVPLVRELAHPLEPWITEIRRRAVHRARGTAPELRHVAHRNVVRSRRCPSRTCARPRCPVFRDRQSHERRGGAGGAEREPMFGLDETLGLPA